MVNPEKAAQAASYAELLKNAKSIYLADYLGLDVARIQELRTQCREGDVRFRVVKNRIMKVAAAEAGFAELATYLEGPTAVAISEVDEVSPAKIITRFAKQHKKPTLKAAVVDGSVFGPEEANAFAKLPSLDEVRAQLLNVVSAPASQIVRLLVAPGTQMVRVIDARKDTLTERGGRDSTQDMRVTSAE